ncbi:MAG TPA: serine/threonine-protein kinase [Vicinamibacterales bacterium]|nr:serine/threonine-protein kinase [Vicinamibacterales bacterium]
MSDWGRVAALFDALSALPPTERDAELARREDTDPALAAEVRSLLAAQDRAGTFLQSPVWSDRPDLLGDDEAPLSGRQLGPYRIRGVLGRGGMGVVYAAEDTRLERLVALKALPPSISGDRVARERLAREARAAAVLTHPGIATVYALDEIDGHVFIASELVRGPTLREELAAGPLPEAMLIDTLAQIADALHAAHSRGIVHRDLKPENVLRDRSGRIKIVDFGLARPLAPATPGLTAAGVFLGTPGYMAPEQLRGQAVDARADVFAFGVMAFELASGRHPFGQGDSASLLERVVADAPLALEVQPAALGPLVRRCLRANPLERYQSAGEIVAALRGVRGSGHADTTRAAAAGDAVWWWQFHQVAVAILTIAAVIVIGFKHAWFGSWGSATFVVVLIAATISVTLRLHVWFTSLVHPALLREVRQRSLRGAFAAEAVLIAAIAAGCTVLVATHLFTAVYLIVTALLLLLSLLVIEPARVRASFDR